MRRKIIFDLDRTLWKCTVEYHPRIRLPRINSETQNVLLYLQQQGYSLNIASRSSKPEKCRKFLNKLFPEIKFDKYAIYQTEHGKLNHILDLNCQDGKFMIFDDEEKILQTIKKVYPLSVCVLCTQPVTWNTIKPFLIYF